MLRLTQVAEELGVSYWTVRRWVNNGKLEAIRLPSGGYRVERSEVERIRSQKVSPK